MSGAMPLLLLYGQEKFYVASQAAVPHRKLAAGRISYDRCSDLVRHNSHFVVKETAQICQGG